MNIPKIVKDKDLIPAASRKVIPAGDLCFSEYSKCRFLVTIWEKNYCALCRDKDTSGRVRDYQKICSTPRKFIGFKKDNVYIPNKL